MNVIRQHFLPRFLLKGFASREKRREIHTWVYRADGKVFEANIMKVGTEKHFYGQGGENTVDAKITEAENEFAPLIDKLRGWEDPRSVDDERIPSFIAHLSIRTRSIQESFARTANHLVESVNKNLFDMRKIKDLMTQYQPLIQAGWEKTLDQFSLSQDQREALLEFMQKSVTTATDEQPELFASLMQPFLETAQTAIPKSIKEGQRNLLSQSLAPAIRVDDYLNLQWYVRKTCTTLILGDSGCFFEIEGERKFRPLNDKQDSIKRVYLPISSDRLLIGCSLEVPQEPDGTFINAAAARCSREFFIGKERSDDWTALQQRIGENSDLFSKNEIDQMIKQWLP